MECIAQLIRVSIVGQGDQFDLAVIIAGLGLYEQGVRKLQ